VGWRRGRWAIEGFFQEDDSVDPTPATLASAGVAVKYVQPVSRHWELYLRGAASHAWLIGETKDYAGRGLGLGAGAQLEGRRTLRLRQRSATVTGALFVEGGSDFYRLHHDGKLEDGDAIDAVVTRITVGWALGTDF